MKPLNLKYWKDELHEAELTGTEDITITTKELSRFVTEIETLRKRVSETPPEEVRFKW